MGIREQTDLPGRERVPLAWTFEQPASAASVHFEVESRAAGASPQQFCTDAQHYYVDRINATREWRVRAVADCETRTAVSKWSNAIGLTQYDSVYQRIKSKGQVDIFVSNLAVNRTSSNGAVRDLTSTLPSSLSAISQPAWAAN